MITGFGDVVVAFLVLGLAVSVGAGVGTTETLTGAAVGFSVIGFLTFLSDFDARIGFFDLTLSNDVDEDSSFLLDFLKPNTYVARNPTSIVKERTHPKISSDEVTLSKRLYAIVIGDEEDISVRSIRY
jgi:hypothetical protein